MRPIALATCLLFLAACDMPTLESYTPVVDPGQTNMTKFNADLPACRAIAENMQIEYLKRQEDEMWLNGLAGAVAGGMIGSTFESVPNATANGAKLGAAVGIANSTNDQDLVTYGPRRIVDRCMADRGFAILNDPGRG